MSGCINSARTDYQEFHDSDLQVLLGLLRCLWVGLVIPGRFSQNQSCRSGIDPTALPKWSHFLTESSSDRHPLCINSSACWALTSTAAQICSTCSTLSNLSIIFHPQSEMWLWAEMGPGWGKSFTLAAACMGRRWPCVARQLGSQGGSRWNGRVTGRGTTARCRLTLLKTLVSRSFTVVKCCQYCQENYCN